MTYFWAKTTAEGKPGISVYDHMVNVGCVAQCIAESSPNLLERFQIQSSTVGALAALHDLGKISPGFQRKCEVWLEENGLTRISKYGRWDSEMEPNHGKVSHAAIQAFLNDVGMDRRTGKFVSAILGAHHGSLNIPDDREYRQLKAITESTSDIDWDTERKKNAEKVWKFFSGNKAISLSDESPSLWWLAGLTSIADWIGSDERFFSPERDKSDHDVLSRAHTALDFIGFQKIEFVQNLSFHDLFHNAEHPESEWIPNEMQEKTFATISGPGVYVIEAPMGMGKTEAALWAAYRLLVDRNATGIYFALPTQATSNRMHIRMNEFVNRITGLSSGSRLIHGNSWLMEEKPQLSPVSTEQNSAIEDARRGRDWFCSSKRALIAPFGVGTIDQALLGVVAAKHFFVRHFALAGKVVILDEVHSYDLYTGTLIDKLITTLEGLGCTVIVLSATLTGKRRRQIVSYEIDNADDAAIPYPLISGRNEGKPVAPSAADPPEAKSVKVDFISNEKATDEAVKIARNGGAVLWICNTVAGAQDQYRQFIESVGTGFLVGLLHSRFPYWRRKQLESKWMELFGKEGKTRCGAILVSTQIVEQSVDLDADLMVTELAPTDMILQRLGRLWRHEREHRPLDTAQLLIIEEEKNLHELRTLEAKELLEVLGGKARVYSPFILLRSLEFWKSTPHVVIPTQIRQFIETTYKDRDDDPESWEKLSNEWLGTNSAKKMLATRNCNLWQVALEDKVGVQTRVNEIPTVPLILCETVSDTEAHFLDNTKSKFDGDQYRLATAQAIHRNLVKVPRCHFDNNVQVFQPFSKYIYGEQCVGVVQENGNIKVNGLKSNTKMSYSKELGLVIEKTSVREAT